MKNKLITLLFRQPDMLPADSPRAYTTMAKDCEEAEERLHKVHKNCEVVWAETGDRHEAYLSYYGPTM